jgi:hypothetical protein
MTTLCLAGRRESHRPNHRATPHHMLWAAQAINIRKRPPCDPKTSRLIMKDGAVTICDGGATRIGRFLRAPGFRPTTSFSLPREAVDFEAPIRRYTNRCLSFVIPASADLSGFTAVWSLMRPIANEASRLDNASLSSVRDRCSLDGGSDAGSASWDPALSPTLGSPPGS